MKNVGARFRNRKINNKQLLHVYRAVDIPDLDESVSLQRSIPQTETGVDKEEESEHHLQAAISASNLSSTTGEAKALYIPTPDASRKIENYHDFYSRAFTEPSTLIRFSSTVEDCIGCPYNMDEEDEKWLKEFNEKRAAEEEKLDEDHFELIMWQFEKITNERVPYLQLDTNQIPTFDDLKATFTVPQLLAVRNIASAVYPWWQERRIKRGGKVITPQLKFEEVVRNEADPYLCFRRRESKPIRKTRRTDQQSIEKLRKLRMEMESARSLLEMVSRREKVRKESLVLEHMIFDQRCKVREYRRNLGIKDDDDDLQHQKKKMRKMGETSATIRIPLNFKDRDSMSSHDDSKKDRSGLSSIESELAKRREDDVGWEDLTDNPSQQSFPVHVSQQCFKPLRASKDVYFRRRIGRGGRIHIDRHLNRPRNAFRDPYDYYDNIKDVYGYDGINTFDKFRFDDDSYDHHDDIVDDLRDGLIRYRCTLLSETDLRSLSTSTRHHFISIGHPGHAQ
ncbi:enhancer of polycomb-like-domain-containing protein [Gamsiella multidivaricata]|uniref:enhancer of polycomb-like-domain-containing protein n=1 Tax=Gamsiella multidivaricata TaxID=101098 RepID=UPI00221F8AC9|nr:enhancer of polycomb-like-domain-containing protein [Gamsiella multidivaricata]KAI7831154.1 enhancer of polycomb-like-domain-containing protein [Gamsiella multidivaricata]